MPQVPRFYRTKAGNGPVILPNEASDALYEVWREDEEKLAWWAVHFERNNWWQHGPPAQDVIDYYIELCLRSLAMELWFSLDPFGRMGWDERKAETGTRKRQEAILDQLISLPISE